MYVEELVGAAAGVIVLLAIMIAMLFVGVEPTRRTADQEKLDELYESMVGDSASVLTGLRDVTEALHDLCLEVASSRGIDESHCTEQPE